jgi:hypothetical protein
MCAYIHMYILSDAELLVSTLHLVASSHNKTLAVLCLALLFEYFLPSNAEAISHKSCKQHCNFFFNTQRQHRHALQQETQRPRCCSHPVGVREAQTGQQVMEMEGKGPARERQGEKEEQEHVFQVAAAIVACMGCRVTDRMLLLQEHARSRSMCFKACKGHRVTDRDLQAYFDLQVTYSFT